MCNERFAEHFLKQSDNNSATQRIANFLRSRSCQDLGGALKWTLRQRKVCPALLTFKYVSANSGLPDVDKALHFRLSVRFLAETGATE